MEVRLALLLDYSGLQVVSMWDEPFWFTSFTGIQVTGGCTMSGVALWFNQLHY